MPLPENKIAQLILSNVLQQISPEEHKELMEGYVNLSTENRLKFKELSDELQLRGKLRDFYALSGHRLPVLRRIKK